MTPSQRTKAEAVALEAILDRIEDRLRDATAGFHRPGPPADPSALQGSEVPADHRATWARMDGISIANAEAILWSLARIAQGPDEPPPGLRVGDVVVGERGRDLLIVPEDPWEEGAEVMLVEETGERWPEASSVPHLLLGWLGEVSVLYDEDGEVQDDIFEEDTRLTGKAKRRLLRRRLDLDDAAHRLRFELAQILREDGERAAARAQLRTLRKVAPEVWWCEHELGRVALDDADPAQALSHFKAAAELAQDPDLRAHTLAFATLAARRAHDEEANALAQAVRESAPNFLQTVLGGVGSLIEREQWAAATDLLALGLAVAPKNAELLLVRGRLRTG